eukprot:768410-Hanusia_phi.AAC.5
MSPIQKGVPGAHYPPSSFLLLLVLSSTLGPRGPLRRAIQALLLLIKSGKLARTSPIVPAIEFELPAPGPDLISRVKKFERSTGLRPITARTPGWAGCRVPGNLGFKDTQADCIRGGPQPTDTNLRVFEPKFMLPIVISVFLLVVRSSSLRQT